MTLQVEQMGLTDFSHCPLPLDCPNTITEALVEVCNYTSACTYLPVLYPKPSTPNLEDPHHLPSGSGSLLGRRGMAGRPTP